MTLFPTKLSGRMRTHFETERLRLRPPTLKDARDIYNYYATDPEVTRYLSWKPHGHVRETRSFLGLCIKAWDEATDFTWVIELRKNNELLGMIGTTPTGQRLQAGYVLKKSAWGMGYTTEALRPLVAAALSETIFERVEAMCHPDNMASARVMEKAGMTFEGRLKKYIVFPNISGHLEDVLIYASTV